MSRGRRNPPITQTAGREATQLSPSLPAGPSHEIPQRDPHKPPPARGSYPSYGGNGPGLADEEIDHIAGPVDLPHPVGKELADAWAEGFQAGRDHQTDLDYWAEWIGTSSVPSGTPEPQPPTNPYQ